AGVSQGDAVRQIAGASARSGAIRMATLARAWDRLIDTLALLAALLFGAMAAYVSYDVVVRYVFNAPAIWANYLSEYSLVCATVLAGPWLVRIGGHVRIDIVVEQLSGRVNRILTVIVSIAAALVCAIGAWQTAIETADYYAREIVIAKIWAVPQWL